jgi:hypothetical protein
MANPAEIPTEDLIEDPIVRHGRREAALVLLIFAAALAYTVGYCSRFGYGRTAESLSFVLGFPSWVFWGVVVPWVVCTAVSFWFSLFYMREEPLEEAAVPSDAPDEDAPEEDTSDDLLDDSERRDN